MCGWDLAVITRATLDGGSHKVQADSTVVDTS